MQNTTKKDIYYSANRLLSYGTIFNFVISNRGGGKTYDFKKRAITRFLKGKGQFIYLRRYKSELKKIKKFFDDIIKNNEFPDVSFDVKGSTFYINGKVCGYALPISTFVTEKSTAYPDITLIGFDEFIIDKGHVRYLPNEVTSLLEMVETIGRMRDDFIVIFMGNAISIINPYFIYWNIKPTLKKRFYSYNQITVEIFKNEDFIAEKEKTRFGQLIKGTDYGEYAVNNEFFRDNNDFLTKKSVNSLFQFSIAYDTREVGFWFDFDDGKIYASSKLDEFSKLKYVVRTLDAKPNHIVCRNYRKNTWLRAIVDAYEVGSLYYETQQIKGLTQDIIYTLCGR